MLNGSQDQTQSFGGSAELADKLLSGKLKVDKCCLVFQIEDKERLLWVGNNTQLVLAFINFRGNTE